MARHDEQTNVRIPAELKEWLKDQAALTAEHPK